MPDQTLAIPHLSLSVTDPDVSEAFYCGVLGGRVGRRTPGWIDVWIFGIQLTLHRLPKAVTPSPYRDAMHFGATVGWDEWPAWLARIERASAPLPMPPRREEDVAKLYVSDPDGYVIEIKAYADRAMLRQPAV